MSNVLTGNNFPTSILKALGIPKHCQSFTLKVVKNEVATLECTFYPEGDESEPITELFNLVKAE